MNASPSHSFATRCPICEAADAVPIVHQAPTPTLQLVLHPTEREAKESPKGTLDLVICPHCEYIWNRTYNASNVDFDPRYESDQTHSEVFSAHVDSVVGRVTSALPDRGCLLEIGCGQGYFLQRVVERAPDRLEAAFGFEPAWRGGRTIDRTTIFGELFAAEARLPRSPDVVIARHVLQYVQQPVAFLSAVRSMMSSGGSDRLFIETRSIEYSLRRGALEDFCYELCSYPDAGSLRHAMTRAGFDVVGIERLFDDQYLLVEAAPAPAGSAAAAESDRSGELLALARRYGDNVAVLRQAVRDRFKAAGRDGKVAIWGAATKGVALATLVDPHARLLDCLIDVNPNKQNRFLPMSCHPVVDARTAAARGVRTAFLANAAYEREIGRTVADMDLPIRIETLPDGSLQEVVSA